MTGAIRAALSYIDDLRRRAESWLGNEQRALRGLALSRILVATAALGLLLTNFSHRHVLWGPASGWLDPYRQNHSFGFLDDVLADTNPTVFTLKYLVVIALAIAVLLGWRTRLTTLLLMLGLTAVVERNGLVGDQGDNIARIGLMLMVLMNTSACWSLDERRRRRTASNKPRSMFDRILLGHRILPAWFANPLHNAALIALALQIFILYTASAMFKIQGSYWQGGTGLYLPLSLPEYSVLPWLNELLTSNAIMVTLATYFAVYVQLFFAVGLLHPLTRRVALVGVILMHLGIAVLMGLPWFSLSMIAFDAIFVSTTTYRSLERWARGRLRPPLRRLTDRLARQTRAA